MYYENVSNAEKRAWNDLFREEQEQQTVREEQERIRRAALDAKDDDR